MKQVKIIIDKHGNEKYETVGYTGGECKEVQIAMIKVGGLSGEVATGEACKTNDLPAYNELGYGGGKS